MRQFSGVVALLLCAAGSLRAQTQTQRAQSAARTRAERELFRVEEEWTRGLVRRDAGIFRRLLDPEFVYSDERGVFNKEQILSEATAGSDTVEAASNEDMVAHVHGNTGVVTGILVTRGRGKDGPFSHRYRYTDTWVKRGGRWICVAAQDYDMPLR
jgi:ketosteroid isomerase-like protein